MKLIVTLSLSLLVACVATMNVAGPRHFPEGSAPATLPAQWTDTRKAAPADTLLTLNILLKQQNLDELEAKFWAVSDPQNDDYGNHLSLEEVTELIGSSDESIAIVQKWLDMHDVDYELLQSRDWIVAKAPLSKVEALFHVHYTLFEYMTTMAAVPATLGPYTLPEYVADHVDIVSGVVGLPDLRPKRPVKGPVMAGDESITPTQIRARYNVTANLTVTNPQNLHACSEFQGQYYSPNDLQLFFGQFLPGLPASDYNISQVIGVNQPGQPGLEASLDVQYLMGVAPGAETWFYSMKSFNFWSDLTTWLGWLGNETTIPSVMTVSYGSQGDYPAAAYQARSDIEYQKLGVRGLSVIYASGDSGAGCGGEGDARGCSLAPSYPATSSYVTSVGATRFISGNTGEEAAVEAFKSGGGFSYFNDQPSYQSSVVQAYLNSGVTLPPATAYNATGRATPDVAALGAEHFLVYQGGGVTPVGGTSASAPSFGAIITLLNDIRLNKGSSTLGFLNPWLYQSAAANPTAFFDVTVGDNISPCCQGAQSGFQCTAGWDPVTGLGTPNFEVLQTLV